MDTGTFIYCRGWSEAKPGHDAEENQDAFQTRLVRDAAGDSALVAVSDGATSTVFADSWARALVAAAEPDWPDLDDGTLTARLDVVREQFQRTLPADLKWYMTAKLDKEGSQATLLAASFACTPGGEIRCQAVAVGDSPLIVFRRDGSTASFPVARSADFGPGPPLVSTKPQPGLRYERWDATLVPGDVLVGCTDAVGKWTLEGAESADRPSVFRLLLSLLGDDGSPVPDTRPPDISLSGRIASSAVQRGLEEDDVTLVLCVPVPPEAASAPLDFARKVLHRHLTSDFELVSAPAPTGITPLWVTVLRWAGRVIRAALRWAGRVLGAALRWVINVRPGRRSRSPE